MKNLFTSRVLTCLTFLFMLWPALAPAAPFAPGNIVVVRIGDGVAPLSAAAQATFLLEYTPSGTLVQTIALPTAVSGTNRALTETGSSTSDAVLTRSADGRYLVLTGYDAAPGTAALAQTSAATVNRIVGRIDANGNVDTSTRINDAYFSTATPPTNTNIRSAASADGLNFYTVGSTNGVRYVPLGNTGATTPLNTTAPTNNRAVNIFGGNLYVSSASGTFQGISQVGTGLPTTAPQTITQLPGFPTASGPQPYAFFFADLSPTVAGVDVLYVTDDRAAPDGGIQKWSLVGGTWVLNGTSNNATSTGIRGIDGKVTGTSVALVASGNSGLYFFTDNTGYNVAPAALPAAIATAGTNMAFRGVAFAPMAATAAAPTITSFTPTNGTVGATVTITGTNLTGATAVTLNGVAITGYTVVNGTTITFTLPTGATSGTIAVTTPGGTATSTGTFTVNAPAPTITSFTPTSGPVGTTITVNGTNFTGATGATLNGTAGTNFTVVSPTQITFTVPTGAASGTIAVTTPGGTATSTGTFTVIAAPTITSFTPTSGPVGTSVTITGANFTGATALTVNGTPILGFTVVNGTTITFTVPAGATSGSIAVTTPGGTATSTGTFTVTVPATAPTITSFSPTSGVAGTTVTFTGTNFTGTTAVTLNGTAAPGFTVNAAGTQLTVNVPVGATTGTFSITSPGGTATSSSFTVNQPSAGRILLDGYRESSYGAAAALQTAATGFGNSTTGSQTNAGGGSELDGAYTHISGDSLYVFLAGNIENNGNTVDVFFDSQTGGQNVLTNTNPNVDNNGLNNSAGLTFDTGFAADYYLGLKGTSGGGITAFFASLGAGGVGQSPASSGTGRVLALNLGNGRVGTLAFDQSNTGGVDGNTANAGLAGAVVTGLEFVLPLSALGTPVGSLKVAAFVNNGNHDYLANQTLGGLPAGTPNLATASAVNFNTYAGNQYFTVAVPASVPTITSFTPTSGTSGATVTITGTNLTGATAVTLNGVAITGYTVVNGTTITFTLPTGATSGNIAVTTAGGTATSTGSFTVNAPAPTITNFTPTTGPVGTTVTVNGTNFTGATGASVNGVAGTNFMVMSPTQVMFDVAAGSTTGPIVVTTPGGTATSATNFTVTVATPAPTITSFTPTTAQAGATVTITGTNFTGATAVTLNGVAITGYTVVNPTTITFTVPATGTSGAIAVTTAGGTATSSTSFTVGAPVAAPTVTGFAPARAVAGSGPVTITISGTNLVAGATATFNGAGAYPLTPSTTGTPGTSATITLPASVLTTVGVYPITVTNSGGTSAALTFLVVAPATSTSYEDFETGTKGAYAAGPVTLRSGVWTFDNAVVGNLFNDKVNQVASARIRGGGFIAMNFDKPNGAGIVTLQAATYGGDTGPTFTAEISTDGGATYSPIAGTPATLTGTLTTYTLTVNRTGPVRLRFGTTNTTVGANPRINIDDLNITDYILGTLPGRALPGLSIYPNPTRDRLTVALTGTGTAQVAVRDLTGRVVLPLAPLAADKVVTLPAGLASGVYLLEVRQDGETAVRRITKE